MTRLADLKPRPRGDHAIRPAWLKEVLTHAEEAYAEECCGILARVPLPGGEQRIEAHRCRNLQSLLHARDPRRHPRSARTAYHIDPEDFLRVGRHLERAGGTIAGIYHSHTDTGAYFSDDDRRSAAPHGVPLLPAVDYLVVSVIAGHVRDARLYAWDRAAAGYVDIELEELDGRGRMLTCP